MLSITCSERRDIEQQKQIVILKMTQTQTPEYHVCISNISSISDVMLHHMSTPHLCSWFSSTFHCYDFYFHLNPDTCRYET